MYKTSDAFKKALKTKHPLVRPLVRFLDSNTIFTGEDIDVSAGLVVTEYANTEEDLTIGAAPSSELEMTVLNTKGLLNDFQYGECQVLLGVRTFRNAWIRGDVQCTAILNYDTPNKVRIDGFLEAPYIKVNGVAPSVQPSAGIYSLIVENNTVYGVYASGNIWTALWDGQSLVETKDYTWADLEENTWLQLEARRWSEYSPVTDLNDFMHNKLRKWSGRGLVFRNNRCWEFLPGFVDEYEYVPLGVFNIETPAKRRGQKVEVSANDRMLLFDADATDWWASISFPITVTEILQKICARCHVPLATTGSFINSDREFTSSPFSADALTYRDLLKWIAEGAASFARMNRNGYLELSWFSNQDKYIETYFNDFDFAEYEVQRITGLQILNADNDLGTLIGSKGNVYQIVDNPIFYSATPEQVQQLGEPIYSRLKSFSQYAPTQVTTLGDWSVQAGDVVTVESKEIPIFKQVITYAGSTRSNYQSTGNAQREPAPTASRQLYRQNRNIHQLNVDIKGIESHSENTDGAVTDLRLFAEGLTIKVTNSNDNTSAVLELKSGNVLLGSQSIKLSGLVTFTDLKTSGKTTINGDNITTGYLSADRIKGGTIDATTINVTNLNANNITSGSFGSDRIANGAITSTKYGIRSIGSDAIGTDAVINRHIQSGSIYPSTCNDTINGYFADVIYTQKVYAGAATAQYMRATYLYGDEFSIGSYQEGALVGHTRVKLLDKDQATQVVGV